MKRLLFLPLCFFCLCTNAQQADTNSLKRLYDRALDFDESKIDSLQIYAAYISTQSKNLHFTAGGILANRLLGIAEDLSGNYDAASVYYMRTLDSARAIGHRGYELAALTDLGYLYVDTKQPQRAKDIYLQALNLALQLSEVSRICTAYLNLGAIYNQLRMPDSALYFLNQGLALGRKTPGFIEFASFYSNLGSVYFNKHEYDRSLNWFRETYARHLQTGTDGDRWLDLLNMAEVFIEKGQFDSGYVYAQQSLDLAKQLASRSKEADSDAMLARLYNRKGDFRQAYHFLEQWYQLDTGLVNAHTNEAIASLQERFHAKERATENKLLQQTIEKANFRNKAITIIAVAALLAAGIIAWLLLANKRANRRLQQKNEFIQQQNERLALLNQEKNELISVVSHDLSTPFAAIKMWLNFLQETRDPEQQKAVQRINQAAERGELLIRSILAIEKSEINQHQLQLEQFDWYALAVQVAESMEPAARLKNIRIETTAQSIVPVMSDRLLLTRVIENLLSNAVKFSPAGTIVKIVFEIHPDLAQMHVIDQGPGISNEDLPKLFSKYGRLSARPTGGEESTGLGLAIVKRILQELDGTVICESSLGKGSRFTVTLKN